MAKKFEIFPKEQGIMAAIWLIFLVFPLIYLFPFNTWDKIAGLVLIIVFAICYRNSYFPEKNNFFWVSMEVLLASIYAGYFGYIALYLFPGFSLGFMFPRKRDFLRGCLIFYGAMFSLVTIVYLRFHTFSFFEDTLVMNIIMLVFATLYPFVGRSVRLKEVERIQFSQSNRRAENIVKREERERIARDLHDTLGQSFSIMTLKSELARKMVERNPEKAMLEMQEVENISRETLAAVRTIVSEMREVLLSEELVSISNALNSAKIIFLTEGEDLIPNIALKKQTILSYCLRECITNIIRHSKADCCWLKIQKVADDYLFIVEDDGIGSSSITAGNGLKGMQERVASLQGTMETKSYKGLTVTMKFTSKELEES